MSRPVSNGVTGNGGLPLGVKKRKADNELVNEQRLAKRFDLLNLGESDLLDQPFGHTKTESLCAEQNGKLYLPVQHTRSARQSHTNGNYESESMHLDDTNDKVYIHNLDDELADIESEEEKLVFLPDIEKKLGKIPKSVLLGEGHPCTSNEVVLYSVPSSLSVPKEQDKVRKAIIESRARAREKQLYDAEAEAEAASASHISGDGGNMKPEEVLNVGHFAADQVMRTGEDEDAMDLG